MSASDVLTEFRRKRELLNNLGQQHATARLGGMWEFLDNRDETHKIIEEIIKEHPRISALIREGKPVNAGSEEEIILVGLHVMEVCHGSTEHLASIAKRFQIVNTLKGATMQSYVNDAMNGYVHHALNFVEDKLERMVEPAKSAGKRNKKDKPLKGLSLGKIKQDIDVAQQDTKTDPSDAKGNNKTKDEKINLLLTYMKDEMESSGATPKTCIFDFEHQGDDYLSFKEKSRLTIQDIDEMLKICLSRRYIKHAYLSGEKYNITDEGHQRAISIEADSIPDNNVMSTDDILHPINPLREYFQQIKLFLATANRGYPEGSYINVWYRQVSGIYFSDIELRDPESEKKLAIIEMNVTKGGELHVREKDELIEKAARLRIPLYVLTSSDIFDSNDDFGIQILTDKGNLEQIALDDFPTYPKLLESHNLNKTNAPNGLDFLNDMPELPPFFKDSSSKINALRAILLEENKSIVIAGESGIGKTTLAYALMRDNEILQNFKDGVRKISFNNSRDVLATLCEVAQSFRLTLKQPNSVESARRLLIESFADKKVLLVLDDCENNEKVKAFSGLGSGVKLVVLTRTENPEEMAELISGVVYRPVPFGGKFQNEPSTIGSGLDMNKRAGKTEICLNANDYAEVLEEVILDGQKDEEGFCFALYGHWGRGKTFLMKLIEGKLKKHNYETIFFSAWKYPTTPEVWIHMYETFVKRAYSFRSKGSAARTVRAGIISKELWPIVIQLLLLAYFAFPKMSALIFISDKVSLVAFFFLILFLFRAKYSLVYLFKKYFTPATHNEKLGLQKTIGDDLAILLQAWVAKEKCTQPSVLQRGALFMSLTLLFLGLWFRLLKVFEVKVLLEYAIIGGILLCILIALCILYTFFMTVGPWPRKVLLVIDDLDRCNVDKIADVIRSIKLFMEEDEIKKRVQVVVLIEEDALRHALAVKYRNLIEFKGIPEDENRSNRIINENIEKLFIGHLRLNELSSEEINQVVSKITGKHIVDGDFQYEPDEHETEISDTSNTTEVTDDSEKDEAVFQDDAIQRSSTVFSRYEHKLMQEQVKKLHGGQYGVKLGPRAIRCFTMKYQVGRLICDKLGLECPAKELIEAIVMCYRGDGDEERENLMLDIAKQVC